MWIAFVPPFQQAASVASGGQPPPPPTGSSLRVALWLSAEPSAGASAAQTPGKPPAVNENILVASMLTLERRI